MSGAPRVTEPLRAEHRALLPHVDALFELAERAGDGNADVQRLLADAVDFLRGHVVPHAGAEEAVLYPAFEAARGSPHATDTMAADHVEIVRRIDALEKLTDAIAGAPDPSQVERLKAQLYGLHAILRLHFDKEEEVLLPTLDAELSEERAAELFAAMERHAHS